MQKCLEFSNGLAFHRCRFSALALVALAGIAALPAGAATSQTIAFDTIPNQIFGVSPLPIAARASSGLPVGIVSTTPAVCKTATDLVLLRSAGTCSITATQGGNASYSAATPVTRSFTVNLAKPSGSFTAAAGNPFKVGTDPSSVAVGDFNGDGIQDLATANANSNNVTVLLGNGSGGFTVATGSPFATGGDPRSVAVGDFNGDGIQDLATANTDGNSATVLLGNGSGGFTAATGSPFAAGTGPDSLVVGDFNGDGIQDLAIANYGTNNVTVLLGTGSGGFTEASGSPFTVGTLPSSLAVGDFNGDGIEDLATANATSNNVTVLLGNGSGGFKAATGSPFTVGTGPYSAAVGDFNGDGVQDLATANATSNNVTVLLGTGSGGFTEASGSPFTVGTLPSSVAVGDFNGDGVQDLATANAISNNVTVLLGTGSGGFTEASGSPFTVGTLPSSVAVGDFNGDGIQDLVTANFTGNNVTVLLGFVAGRLPQTITFGPLSNQVLGSSLPALSATASSGLAVALNSAGDCMVSGVNITLEGTGTCSITASQTGNATYAPATPVTQRFTVTAAAITPPTADLVSPNTGAGLNQAFSFKYSSVNGYGYLSQVHALFNGTFISTGACWVVYVQAANTFYLFNDTATVVLGPLTPGSAGVLSNGQCTLNGNGSTVTGSGNTLTMTLALNFSGSFTGTQTIYGASYDAGNHNSGWQNLGNWQTAALIAQAPTADSVSPDIGGSSIQTFTFKYSSVNGYTYLSQTHALLNGTLNGAGACWVAYLPAPNALYLLNDTGTAVVGPLAPGSPGTLSNSQCTLTGVGSTVTGSGNTLTMTLALNFSVSFSATQTIYGISFDNGNRNSGWQNLGSWITSAVIGHAPTVDSVSPNTGAAATQIFAFKYSSFTGYGFLSQVHALINGTLNGVGACWVYYLPATNSLYLFNDSQSAALGPLTPGLAGTLSNSQCTLNGSGSAVTGSGNTLTMTLSLAFSASFTGTQTIYGISVDNGNVNSGWQDLGSWKTAAVLAQAPTADSVSPNTGAGASQTFTFKYSSVNGYSYLSQTHALLNGTLSGTGACWVASVTAANALYLLNDAGTAVLGPLAPGSAGTLSNSQCTLNGTGSAVTSSGNTLTMTLSLTFGAAFTGTQTIYGLSVDNGNLNSGWQNLGSWKTH